MVVAEQLRAATQTRQDQTERLAARVATRVIHHRQIQTERVARLLVEIQMATPVMRMVAAVAELQMYSQVTLMLPAAAAVELLPKKLIRLAV